MQSLPELFLHQVVQQPDEAALHVKQHGEYRTFTWRDVLHDARRYILALEALGVGADDRVVQFSENRHEWILTDLALGFLGAIHVPVHATLSGAQVVEQTVDCGARLLLVSSDALARHLAASTTRLPEDVHVVSFEPTSVEVHGRAIPTLGPFDGDAPGETEHERAVHSRLTPESIATILYTSGTTGRPKGVVLSQRNLVTNCIGAVNALGSDKSDLQLSFLPLSHIFARTCDLYGWIARGGRLALAESRETVVPDCQVVHPTMLCGVPYFFARLRKFLADQGRENAPDAVKSLLGGRIQFCCSGGAPLTVQLYDYFQSQGVPLLQGYGLTESSPVITVSSLAADRRGAVGKAIEDAEIRIADDGEVLTRGPHVMVGYWRDDAATGEVVKDGWLFTGDLGRLDEDGFLYITGRKKELIVTATGKNVAPALLEALLTEDPVIFQAMVVGDDRSHIAALIVPEQDELRRVLRLDSATIDLSSPAVRELVLERVSARLADLSHDEQVRRITLLPRAFCAERGELTAKLSQRRAVIAEHFAAEIDAMYDQ